MARTAPIQVELSTDTLKVFVERINFLDEYYRKRIDDLEKRVRELEAAIDAYRR